MFPFSGKCFRFLGCVFVNLNLFDRYGPPYIQYDDTNCDHILNYLRFGILSDGVIKNNCASLLANAEFYMLPNLKERINNYHNVKLIFRTEEVVVSRRVLNKFPESLFGRMLSGEKGNYAKRKDGSYFINYDVINFHHILNYLRFGILSEDAIEQNSETLCEDADFYMLPGLREQINNYYYVKIIIGTKEFVVSREKLSKFPKSLFAIMLEGREGNYIRRKDGSYFIDRDPSTFPCILDYLNYGAITENHSRRWYRKLFRDAIFYGLPDLVTLVLPLSRTTRKSK